MRRVTEEKLARYREGRSIPWLLAGVALFTALPAPPVTAQSPIERELQNLRALPFGYRTWCESGNLVLQSRSSARFRIRNAALCSGKPEGHVVCESAPKRPSTGVRENVPLCSEIDAPGV